MRDSSFLKILGLERLYFVIYLKIIFDFDYSWCWIFYYFVLLLFFYFGWKEGDMAIC